MIMTEFPETLNPRLFVEKDVSKFECPLCFEVLTNPTQCRKGHVYCRECIVTALGRSEKCPTCDDPLTVATVIDCLFAKQQIADLQVYCFTRLDELEAGKEPETNSNSGSSNGGIKKMARRLKAEACTWIGKLEDAEKHFHECPYAGVLCKFAPECDLADLRKDIHEHEKNCYYRTCPCKWCGEQLTHRNGAIAHHEFVCNKRETACSNWADGCRVKVPKDELMLHESTCEWSRVPCPLAGDDDDPFLLYIYFPLHR